MRLNKLKENKIAMAGIAIGLAVLVFGTSYGVSYFYNKQQVTKTNAVIDNTDIMNSMVLDDHLKITTRKRTVSGTVSVEDNILVEDFKKSIGVEEVTKKEVITTFEDKGYVEVFANSEEIIFEKSAETLEPNKYYIGEKDGKIAMFKTDAKGYPSYEATEDYREKSVDSLPSQNDISNIKNFNLKYDTKDECEEALSGFTS